VGDSGVEVTIKNLRIVIASEAISEWLGIFLNLPSQDTLTEFILSENEGFSMTF
jgi:hypothetical protein